MNRAVKSILLLSLLAVGAAPASAFPAFLQIFQADPFRNPEVSGCMACPIDPLGGGPRNEFGLAFADNGMTITPLLRAQCSDSFTYNTAPLGGLTILHFSDPENAVLVVEVDGQRYLADPSLRSIEGAPRPEPVAATPQGLRRK